MDVEDLTEIPDPLFDDIPEKKLPEHRARRENPRVKMVDDPNLTALQGAISVKSRVKGQPRVAASSSNSLPAASVQRRPKPGPGRSSTGLLKGKNTSSVLVASKGTLKSVKGKYRKEETHKGPTRGGDSGSPIFVDDDEGSVEMKDAAVDPPTAGELLQLAGLDEKAAEALPDFDDEPEQENVPPPVPVSTTDVQVTVPDPKVPVLNDPEDYRHNIGLVVSLVSWL